MTTFEYQNFASLGVNLARQKYGPLDISAVFNSEDDLKYYLSKGAHTSGVSDYWQSIVPYPYAGQLIATVIDDKVDVYVLAAAADGTFITQSIIVIDESTLSFKDNGELTLAGLSAIEDTTKQYISTWVNGKLVWVESKAEALEAALKTHEAVITNHSITINDHTAAIDAVQAEVTKVVTDVTRITANLNTLSSTVSANADDIKGIQSTQAEFEAVLKENKEDVASISDKLDQVTAELTNIEVSINTKVEEAAERVIEAQLSTRIATDTTTGLVKSSDETNKIRVDQATGYMEVNSVSVSKLVQGTEEDTLILDGGEILKP